MMNGQTDKQMYGQTNGQTLLLCAIFAMLLLDYLFMGSPQPCIILRTTESKNALAGAVRSWAGAAMRWAGAVMIWAGAC